MPGATTVLVAVVIAFGAVLVAVGVAFVAAIGAAVLSPPFEPFCPKRGNALAGADSPRPSRVFADVPTPAGDAMPTPAAEPIAVVGLVVADPRMLHVARITGPD